MNRIHNACYAMCDTLRKYLEEVPDTIAVIEGLHDFSKANNVPEDILSKFDGVSELLENMMDFDPDKLLRSPEYPEGWPTMKHVKMGKAWQKKLEKAHDKLELQLCRTRTLIFQMWEVTLLLNLPMKASLGDKLEKEKERHLKHREEDRAAKLKHLEHLHWVEKRKAENTTDPKLKADYEAAMKKLQQRIDKVKAVTPEELMQNRKILHGI